MAQEPIAISILQFLRNSYSTCTFSALQMPPSIRPMSQGEQCLISVIGERSNSTSSSSVSSRSSMSSRDMWQPKQPASEVVAILSFGFIKRHPLEGINPFVLRFLSKGEWIFRRQLRSEERRVG